MLIHNFVPVAVGYLLFTLLLYVCMGYSYYLNAQRAADDSKKKDIPLGVVLFAPITWPLLLVGVIFLLIIKIVIYALLLILFTIALIVIRKPFFFTWLKKTAAWIGDKLLEANLFLIRIAFGSHSKKTQTT